MLGRISLAVNSGEEPVVAIFRARMESKLKGKLYIWLSIAPFANRRSLRRSLNPNPKYCRFLAWLAAMFVTLGYADALAFFHR
jgi:hypothetical protein